MSCPPKKIVYTGVNRFIQARNSSPSLCGWFFGDTMYIYQYICLYMYIYVNICIYICIYIVQVAIWGAEGSQGQPSAQCSARTKLRQINERPPGLSVQNSFLFNIQIKLSLDTERHRETPRDTERQRHSRVDMIASLGDQLALRVGVASRKWSSIFGKTTILQLKE